MNITDKAQAQVQAITSPQQKYLRISVGKGGCSGFKYMFGLENIPNELDTLFAFHGTGLIVDRISMSFLEGASLDYETSLMKSGFVVISAINSHVCGCGESVYFDE